MAENLKPCPFCGSTHIEGPKQEYIERASGYGYTVYNVGHANVSSDSIKCIAWVTADSEEEAIERWNRRAGDERIASQEKQNAKLRESLDRTRASFFVNMIRAFPDKSREEIQAEIDKLTGQPATAADQTEAFASAFLDMKDNGIGVTRRNQDGSIEHVPFNELRAEPPATAAGDQRDRAADRQRFTDLLFNKWLDEGISDAGHTVWDQIGDTQSAWAGWENRPFYTQPTDKMDK